MQDSSGKLKQHTEVFIQVIQPWLQNDWSHFTYRLVRCFEHARRVGERRIDCAPCPSTVTAHVEWTWVRCRTGGRCGQWAVNMPATWCSPTVISLWPTIGDKVADIFTEAPLNRLDAIQQTIQCTGTTQTSRDKRATQIHFFSCS